MTHIPRTCRFILILKLCRHHLIEHFFKVYCQSGDLWSKFADWSWQQWNWFARNVSTLLLLIFSANNFIIWLHSSRERVDLTFFDAHTNDSHIDLGSIPLPVQTNQSGEVLTKISPINIGGFSDPREILSTLPITGTIANLTHSDTAFFQVTKSNQELDNPNENILTPEDIAEIPEVGNVFPEIKHHPEKIREEKWALCHYRLGLQNLVREFECISKWHLRI